MQSWRAISGLALLGLWLVLSVLSYHDLLLCSQRGAGNPSNGAAWAAVEWVYVVGVGLGALSVLWLRAPLLRFFGSAPLAPS
jgi:hypothetical protein